MPYRVPRETAKDAEPFDATIWARAVGVLALVQVVWSLAPSVLTIDPQRFVLGRAACLLGAVLVALPIAVRSRDPHRRLPIVGAFLAAAANAVLHVAAVRSYALMTHKVLHVVRSDCFTSSYVTDLSGHVTSTGTGPGASSRVAVVLFAVAYAGLGWAITRPNVRLLAWLAVACAAGAASQQLGRAQFDAFVDWPRAATSVPLQALVGVAAVAVAGLRRRRDDLRPAPASVVWTLAAGIIVCAVAVGFISVAGPFSAGASTVRAVLTFWYGAFFVGALLLVYVARRVGFRLRWMAFSAGAMVVPATYVGWRVDHLSLVPLAHLLWAFAGAVLLVGSARLVRHVSARMREDAKKLDALPVPVDIAARIFVNGLVPCVVVAAASQLAFAVTQIWVPAMELWSAGIAFTTCAGIAVLVLAVRAASTVARIRYTVEEAGRRSST